VRLELEGASEDVYLLELAVKKQRKDMILK
jgi:hypothetical protein